METREEFWSNALNNSDTLDSKEMYEQLCTDLPQVIVCTMMETLSRGEGVCADLPGGHTHLTWVGYGDWYAVS